MPLPLPAEARFGTARERGWHNRRQVEATLGPLLPLFERERRAGRTLALGVLVQTQGSTYRKPGALIAIAANGDYAGLLSGGCLEGDLREHAVKVIREGRARTVRYDLQGPDELLWGLGLGCEGAMRILLLPVGPATDWQPLAYLAAAFGAQVAAAFGVVCDSAQPEIPLGSLALPEPAAPGPPALRAAAVQNALAQAAREGSSRWLHGEEAAFGLFLVPLMLPPRLLLLGAGPDAVPVVEFAARLAWRITVSDHRAAYANAAHFPAAQAVRHMRPEELAGLPELENFQAAVVMSHHLATDLAYLRALAAARIPYVGLLGPPNRRDKLLARLGHEARALRGRLYAPIGLPLGGRTPEAVALTIVAEVQAFLQGRLREAQAGIAALPRAASAD